MAHNELREGPPIPIVKTPDPTPDPPRARTVAPARPLRDKPPNPVKPPTPDKSSACEWTERPCPFVGCRFHLLIEVTIGGGLRLNKLVKGKRPFLPARERDPAVIRRWIAAAAKAVEKADETCVLDVARKGEATLEEVGRLRGVTKEMVRLDQHEGMRKVREAIEELLDEDV